MILSKFRSRYDASRFGPVWRRNRTGGRAPLDQVTGVTITGTWSHNRVMLSSFAGDMFRVRDTTGDGTAFEDVATPADAVDFLNGNAGAIVSIFDQSGNSRTLTNATTTEQPVFETGLGANMLAGAQFDNTDDKLVGPALSNFFSVSSGYVVVVAQFDDLTASSSDRWRNQALWSASTNSAGAFGRVGHIDSMNFNASSADYAEGSVISTDTIFVHEWLHDDGTLYSRVNAGTWYSVASGDSVSATGLFAFGKSTANAAMNGTIFEGFCMSGKPSQSDDVVADMMTYHAIAA